MPLEFGTTMKAIRSALIAMCLFPAFGSAMLSQTAGKAVITPAAPVNAAPVPAPAPAGGPVDNATYVIGPDDQIQVTVWGNTQLSGSVVVRPDGKISLPLVNDIQAAGYTPTQLADNLTKRLTKFVTDPTVGVIVLAVKSKNVYLMGEVNHVGPIQIAPGMTVLQAIATAGGLSPYANTKKMYILRGDPGHQKQIRFDYKKAIRGDMQGISLQPGDTIFVP
jgi:polysaccharide biosynthesis/export protein